MRHDRAEPSSMIFPRIRSIDGQRRLVFRREALMRETVEPASAGETVFQNVVSSFWAETFGQTFTPNLIRFVWVAERCIQLVAQNIAAMPLRFAPGAPNSREPAWLHSPDPVWYPNGVADAIFSLVDSYYRYGDGYAYATVDYADGFPSAWTVLPAAQVGVEARNGRRVYDLNGERLDDTRVIQISRNPRGNLKGTSAYQAYAEVMVGMGKMTAAAGDAIGNLPLTLLKSSRPLDGDQARDIQTQWTTAGRDRLPGAPAIIPPELDFAATKLQFSPEEMLLVDVQEFNARVLGSACGVPPFLLSIALTGGLTYQNPAMLGEYWWRTELYGTCARIARAFTSRMLPAGSSVWFDPDHLIGPLGEQEAIDESPAVKASPADIPAGANVVPIQEGITA